MFEVLLDELDLQIARSKLTLIVMQCTEIFTQHSMQTYFWGHHYGGQSQPPNETYKSPLQLGKRVEITI